MLARNHRDRGLQANALSARARQELLLSPRASSAPARQVLGLHQRARSGGDRLRSEQWHRSRRDEREPRGPSSYDSLLLGRNRACWIIFEEGGGGDIPLGQPCNRATLGQLGGAWEDLAVTWHRITQRDAQRSPLPGLVIGEISARPRILDAAARGAGIQLQKLGDLSDRNLILAKRPDGGDGLPRLGLDCGVDTFSE